MYAEPDDLAALLGMKLFVLKSAPNYMECVQKIRVNEITYNVFADVCNEIHADLNENDELELLIYERVGRLIKALLTTNHFVMMRGVLCSAIKQKECDSETATYESNPQQSKYKNNIQFVNKNKKNFS